MTRVFVVLAVIATSLSFSAPASAGTLTNATWSVMDPRTNSTGNRFDYNLTTATAGVIDRVTATVPAGTTGANRYLATNYSNNFASTPDSASNSVSTNLDVRAKVSFPTWPPSDIQQLAYKRNSTNTLSYSLSILANGNVEFKWSADGTVAFTRNSTMPFTPAANQPFWVRGSIDTGQSTGTRTGLVYYSLDGTTWTSFGTAYTASGAQTLFDSNLPLTIGAWSSTESTSVAKVYFASVGSGIGGATSASGCSAAGVTNCFDPGNASVGTSSWTSASPAAEPWSITRTGSAPLADIASDLSVMNVSGVGVGTAQLREIDGVASFKVANPINVAAGTAIKLGLAGMTSSYATGSPTSTIRTFTSANVEIDSAATNAVAFTGPTISTYAGSTPNPTGAISPTSIDVAPVAIATRGTHTYFTDSYGANVYDVDSSTGLMTKIAGSGYAGVSSGDGGPATAAVFNEVAGIAVDSAGNIAIAEKLGCRVRQIDIATKVISTIAGNGVCTTGGADGTAATSASFNQPYALAYDASNSLFVGSNRVSRITSGLIYSYATGLAALGGLAIDSTGNIYVSQTGNNDVRKYTAANTFTVVAGGGTCGAAPYGDGAAATSACLAGPKGLAIDASNNLFITDSNHNMIRRVDAATQFISTVAGTGTAGSAGDGAAAMTATFGYPDGLAVRADGTVLVGDTLNRGLRAFTVGGNISTVAGKGPVGFGNDGGAAALGTIFNPSQISTTPSGNLLVAGTPEARIRQLGQFGNITTVAGNQVIGSSGNGGSATSASLNQPEAAVADSAGNIFIADTSSQQIRKVTQSTGVISTFAGGTGRVGDLTINPAGTELYFTTNNTGSCFVKKVPIGGGTVTTVAGTGTCGFDLESAADPLTIQLNSPRALRFDSLGNLFIADSSNNRVRMISASNGPIKTVAGGGVGATDNVPATTVQLGIPSGLTIDALNNVYVAENSSGRIRRFVPGGPIVTIAGTGVLGFNGDGGPANAAQLSRPFGIAIANGALYITERGSQRIRRIADLAPMAPLVNNDSISVPMSTNRQWPILSNDWSRTNEMDPSSVVIKTAPTNGTVTLIKPSTEASTMQVSYTPTNGFTGSDSFTYTACDTTRVQCGTATATVTVSSNAFTTVGGGLSEGYAKDIGFTPQDVTRFGNYLFLTDNTQSAIRRVDIHSGQMVTVVGNGVGSSIGENVPAAIASINTPRGVSFAPDGTMVFTEFNSYKVRLVSTAGVISTIAGAGANGNGPDGSAAVSTNIANPIATAFGPDGSIYLSTTARIRKFTIGGTMSTVAGTGTASYSGDGGLATSATVSQPMNIIFTADGSYYFADLNTRTIRKVSTGGIITTIAGSGGSGSAGDGGLATSAQLNQPRSMLFTAAGDLLIADTGNSRIRKVTTSTGIITTIAGGGAGNADNGGSPTGVALNQVGGLALARDGISYWFADTNANKVRFVDASNVLASGTVQGNGLSRYSGDGFQALTTTLNNSDNNTSMAVDSSGNIYQSEPASHRIRRIDIATGLVSTWVGNGVVGNSQTSINNPRQITFDGSGNLVFAESGTGQIRRRNSDGSLTLLVGNNSNAGVPTLGGSPTATTFGLIRSLAYLPNGDLIFADSNARLYRVRAGIVTAFAGNGNAGFAGDGGLATSAQISSTIYDLSVDTAGNLYFVDFGNSRIRMVDTAGNISTIAGNGTTTASGEGGQAIAAGLGTVRGIAVDSGGNIFLSESTLYKVRKIDRTSGVIATIAGTGINTYNENTALLSASFGNTAGMAVFGSDLYFLDQSSSRIKKLAGVAELR